MAPRVDRRTSPRVFSFRVFPPFPGVLFPGFRGTPPSSENGFGFPEVEGELGRKYSALGRGKMSDVSPYALGFAPSFSASESGHNLFFSSRRTFGFSSVFWYNSEEIHPRILCIFPYRISCTATDASKQSIHSPQIIILNMEQNTL